ncbi:cobalt ECF transporter T component CbiQ [Thermodesulfobacteriota bacterium]
MVEEDFATGNSLIHNLDPRVKTIIASVFSVIVGVSDRYSALIPALFIALIFVFLAQLPFKKVCLRLVIVNGLLLLLWVFIPFTMEGQYVLSFGPLNASKEGIAYSVIITIKANSIILTLIALMSTMPVFTMGKAMRHMHVPAKMVHLFLFTYRYIHAIHREYLRLISTVKIRGFQPASNMHTYRTYAYLVGMLFIRSHDRAQRVRAAMLCRGFKGRFYDLSEFSIKTSDVVVMGLSIMAVITVGLLQWTKIIY